MASISRVRVETVVDMRILNYSRRYPTNVVSPKMSSPKNTSSPRSASSSNANRPATIRPASIASSICFAETVKDIARVRTYSGGRLRQTSALRVSAARRRRKSGTDSGAGPFRYRVAAGNAAQHAVPSVEGPPMGAGRVRHEGRAGAFSFPRCARCANWTCRYRAKSFCK